MKTYFFILAFLVGTLSKAQDSCIAYNVGGFGHFYTGPSYLQQSDLHEYLESGPVLGTNLPFRSGNMSGGEGACVLGRFIIGGGGFGQSLIRKTTDSARATVSFGGGYFKFGYIFHFHKENLLYGYAGTGWGGLNVHIENLSSESYIKFNHLDPISPGSKGDYEMSYNFYDFGVSWKHLFATESDGSGAGGVMLGFDAGLMVGFSNSDWQTSNDRVVSGPPVPGAFMNPYVRLTIGGGGFSWN